MKVLDGRIVGHEEFALAMRHREFDEIVAFKEGAISGAYFEPYPTRFEAPRVVMCECGRNVSPSREKPGADKDLKAIADSED
jgi:hypothetical protein